MGGELRKIQRCSLSLTARPLVSGVAVVVVLTHMLSSRFQNPSGAQMSAVRRKPMDSTYMEPNTVMSPSTGEGQWKLKFG